MTNLSLQGLGITALWQSTYCANLRAETQNLQHPHKMVDVQMCRGTSLQYYLSEETQRMQRKLPS